jgi:hypothetical protein
MKLASEGDALKMAGSVLKSPEARFLNFEAHFSPSFLDAPARIQLRGFEAEGGGKLPVTLLSITYLPSGHICNIQGNHYNIQGPRGVRTCSKAGQVIKKPNTHRQGHIVLHIFYNVLGTSIKMSLTGPSPGVHHHQARFIKSSKTNHYKIQE